MSVATQSAAVSNALWSEFNLPPRTYRAGKRGRMVKNRSAKVRAAERTVNETVAGLTLPGEQLTQDELTARVKDRVRADEFGFFNPMWLYYAWQVAQWVAFIWQQWHKDQAFSE